MSKPFTASNIAFNEYHEQIKCGIDLSAGKSFFCYEIEQKKLITTATAV